jgi:5'-phosphate synthase pdxT subunit
MKIGVLALQGDFEEHLRALEKCGVERMGVRLPQELDEVAGLIIPGGESTTIGKLMDRYGISEKIRQRHAEGMPIYGTCAGLILLAKDIVASQQTRLGLMNVTVERNAYGRQVDSFEADVPAPRLGEVPLRAVFIRAPVVRQVESSVEALATHDNVPILIQEGNLLASSFHPELTDDLRVHRYFLEIAGKSQ